MTAESLFQTVFIFLLVFLVLGKLSGKTPDASVVVRKLLGVGFFICIELPFKILKAIFKSFFSMPASKVENNQFQGFWERRKILHPKNDGLVIDGENRLSLEDSFTHLCLVAPTGAGKTSRYIINTVLQLDHSMVITDPSGEIFKKTSGALVRKGFKIKVLAPGDLSNSFRYNPISRAKSHGDLNRISDILINSAFGGKTQGGDQSFWNNGAKTVLNIFLRMLKVQESRYQNLGNLRHLLNSYGEDGAALDSLATGLDEMTFLELRSFISQDIRVTQNVLSTAKAALEPFTNPDLCRLTATDNLNFESLRTEKTAIYIIVPEHLFGFYGFLLSMLYTQLFSFVLESEGRPIFFLLDEFANVGRIPGFSNLITVLRKKRCSVSIILQDLEQLNLVYGNAETSVIVNGGCANKIFFPGLSPTTCKQVEQMLGKTVIETDSGKTTKPLLAASEVRTMSHEIFIQSRQAPVRISMKPYYKIKKLETMSQTPPHRIEISSGEDKIEFLPLDVSAKKY